MSAQDTVMPVAAPTGCSIWPVPNRRQKKKKLAPPYKSCALYIASSPGPHPASHHLQLGKAGECQTTTLQPLKMLELKISEARVESPSKRVREEGVGEYCTADCRSLAQAWFVKNN